MKIKYWVGIIVVGGIVLLGGGYKAFITMDPNLTCAQCHEINAACTLWEKSVHSDVGCIECHGSAFSNGVGGLMEKANMIYCHFTKKITNEDIYLNEDQVLTVSGRCAVCHQAEYAAWKSGAHSVTYEDIFMDKEHNIMEKPYWDCFRCHGMYYDGNINDLMSLEGPVDEWYIKDTLQINKPTITCLTCHQVHYEQQKSESYQQISEEEKSSLMTNTKSASTAFYMRSDKRHIPSDKIYQTTMFKNDSIVKVSDDPNTWLCMQCHSPNSKREIGSEDDKTPMGIYEGRSCLDCHNPHSNGLKNNYRDIHNIN